MALRMRAGLGGADEDAVEHPGGDADRAAPRRPRAGRRAPSARTSGAVAIRSMSAGAGDEEDRAPSASDDADAPLRGEERGAAQLGRGRAAPRVWPTSASAAKAKPSSA